MLLKPHLANLRGSANWPNETFRTRCVSATIHLRRFLLRPAKEKQSPNPQPMRTQIKHLFYAGLVGITAISSHAQSYSNAVVALHPAAYYPLNETTQPPASVSTVITNYGADTSLNMNYQGDLLFVSPGPLASQPLDSSVFFNGNGTFASAPFDSNLGNQPSFTIEAWLLARNISSTECPTADFEANSPRSGWLIYMDISHVGQYTFRAYNQNGATPSLSFDIGAPGSITPGQWYHLAVVVNASGGATNVSGYINGVLASGPTALTSYVPNDGLDGGLSAGGRSDNAFPFDGNIDELAYYTNALSAATILSHYQAATNLSPATPYDQLVLQQNPLAYYRFNQGALPAASNHGSFGTNANAFYTVGSSPGSVAGPTNTGFGGLPALQLNPFNTQSAGTAGPGAWAAPLNPDAFNLTNALSVAFWAQVPTFPAYFQTVIGRGDGSWRFDVDPTGNPHWAASPNGDLIGPAPLADNNWHFWAGVFDPVAGVGTLYVDGVAVINAPWSALSSNAQYPLLIGGAPDYANPARNFSGNIAQVSVYTNALTAAQVNSLYAAAGGSPATAAVVLNLITIDEGANTNIVATAGGSAPLTVQWFVTDTTSTTTPIAGATNLTLGFTNISAALSGNQYFIVATNPYGTATSGSVTLNVIQGAPTIQSDVTPLNSSLPVGVSDQFSVSVTGSQPFSYHWYHNSVVIPGATNSVYPFTVLSGTNTYSVIVSNAFGPASSSVATVVGLTSAPPIITFGDGSLWTTNSSAGPGSAFPQFNAGSLLLTDGNASEAASSFYMVEQYIGGFVAAFTYVASNAVPTDTLADGATFVVQNSAAGSAALGAGGGDLGFYGIENSASFEINIYPLASGNVGVAYGTNGATPGSAIPLSPYTPTSPVSFASGDPISVRLYVNAGVMVVNLKDLTTGATFTGSHNFGDLVPIVNGSSAFVGFTAGTGGLYSIQTVSNFQFSYTTPPVLTVTSSNNNAVVTWPVSVSTLFKLQKSSTVTGSYANVTTAPTIVNGMNQITVPQTGTSQFFRLFLP